MLARKGRWLAISTVAGSGAGHVGGPFSAMDILVTLYFRVMKIDPKQPRMPARDRFILSKGHASIGQYSVMALRGFLPVEELKTFDKGGSRLQGHPDVTRLPGLETSTGSLGQGLSVGLGIALGARLRGEKFQTFVMIGDQRTASRGPARSLDGNRSARDIRETRLALHRNRRTRFCSDCAGAGGGKSGRRIR